MADTCDKCNGLINVFNGPNDVDNNGRVYYFCDRCYAMYERYFSDFMYFSKVGDKPKPVEEGTWKDLPN